VGHGVTHRNPDIILMAGRLKMAWEEQKLKKDGEDG
jgi:hypothetical protein